jgi:hypothetical protein
MAAANSRFSLHSLLRAPDLHPYDALITNQIKQKKSDIEKKREEKWRDE